MWFNDYCTSKGKVMTISFTTQRSNWQELPKMIEFCNEHGIQLFNSYVMTPVNQAIWNLPKEKLKEILNFMTSFKIAASNQLQNYNVSCLNDFIQYITGYNIQADEPANTTDRSAMMSVEELWSRVESIFIKHNQKSARIMLDKLKLVFKGYSDDVCIDALSPILNQEPVEVERLIDYLRTKPLEDLRVMLESLISSKTSDV